MDKKPLIGLSICAVVLLVLGSLSNVVGYQSVQSSNQSAINNEVNQRELLFQTIVDIANNKEIQRIILKSQMMNGKFLSSDVAPITKQQLKQMYFIGLILSKVISKSRMQSIIGEYQFDNQEMQKEISTIIENNPTLNEEISQLQTSECDCENEKTTDSSKSPVICFSLFILYTFIFGICLFLVAIFGMGITDLTRALFGGIVEFIDYAVYYLDCNWSTF